ncbi:unnamed protein product [Heterobilharzia americana]|nr:unnamed protein product [Heterobilharzia americana]
MEFILSQQHYTDIKTTSRNSAHMLLLSSKVDAKQRKCRLIVADNSGEIHLFHYINELKHFKFSVEPPITCIRLGLDQNDAKQRIFICHNYKISVFSLKGKQIFQHNSNIQGYVNSMFIQTADIYCAVGCMFQKLTNFKDTEFLLLPDFITSIYVIQDGIVCSLPLVVLTCKDKLIRVLKNGAVSCELEVSSSPVCLNVADKSYPLNYLMYGTFDGQFGLIKVTSKTISKIWEVSSKSGSDEVLSLEHYNMFDNSGGHEELIVSYTGGRIELYTYDQNQYPSLIYETNVNHHLTYVKACRFSNINYPELLCVTYTGMIFGLTTEPIRKRTTDIHRPDSMQLQFTSKLDKLNDEISELESQLNQMKNNQNSIKKEQIVLIPLELDYKYYLNKDLSAYCLNLETQIPIDHILVQSDCYIDLLDIEENTAVCSPSVCKKTDRNVILTTYRCQINTTHFEIQFRTIEGQYGQVLVYVVPKMNISTVTACKSIRLFIHPLSLHRLFHHVDDDYGDNNVDRNRLWNTLLLTGRFHISEIHNWLSICLPEVPERPKIITPNDNCDDQEITECAQLFHESIYFKTHIQSDNISTIAILKDVLTKEATKRKIQLTIKLDIHPNSVELMLRKIDPEVIYLRDLEEKVVLIEPITEMISNKIQCFNAVNKNGEKYTTLITNKYGNPFPECLPLEYAQIWQNGKKLKQEFKHKSYQLKIYYVKLIITLFIFDYYLLE